MNRIIIGNNRNSKDLLPREVQALLSNFKSVLIKIKIDIAGFFGKVDLKTLQFG